MSASLVHTATAQSIYSITLSRPDQRNAMTLEMLEALTKAVRSPPDDARALLLSGAGRVFCAGFDLALCRAQPDGSVMRTLLSGLSTAILALRALPIPVVIAAHGAAIAGGCALLGGADIVVADRAARLGYPVVRLGVSPAVSAPFLAPMTGPGKARERLLDPGLIDGVEAHRIGLIHDLVDLPEQVMRAAHAAALSLTLKPPGAVRATRQWMFEIDAMADEPGRALRASLSLTGGAEETERLATSLK